MLDYTSLFALSAVVREGSFERAAQSMHVTPSAVSQRIRQLEERVGCALVVRGQPCTATPTGQRLCQHADRVRLLESELHTDLPSLAPDHHVQVHVPVAVNADSLATWFPQVLDEFAKQSGALVQLSVDDEEHTAQWLRSGAVLAAVTAHEAPATGCSVTSIGSMQYVAAASPAFIERYFSTGVHAQSLAVAPSLMFNAKDTLQRRWALRLCGQLIELPSHTLPSSHGFVAACLAGIGWALHPLPLVKEHLDNRRLVELVPDTRLHVPLFWQQARMASALLQQLSHAVKNAATETLVAKPDRR